MVYRARRAILLWLFDLLYHRFAWAYDAVSAVVSLGQWRAWGEAALDFAPGSRVLELGHGPGHLLAALEREGQRPVGIDLSPQMGRLARRRLKGYGLPVRLARGRGQALPFSGDAFNAIVATFPAPYILEAATLAEIRRVLRPGGRLVIVPEAELIDRGLPGRMVDWLYRVTGQRVAPDEGIAGRDAMWIRPLGVAGFEVTVSQVRQEGSVVVVVVAEKSGD